MFDFIFPNIFYMPERGVGAPYSVWTLPSISISIFHPSVQRIACHLGHPTNFDSMLLTYWLSFLKSHSRLPRLSSPPSITAVPRESISISNNSRSRERSLQTPPSLHPTTTSLIAIAIPLLIIIAILLRTGLRIPRINAIVAPDYISTATAA